MATLTDEQILTLNNGNILPGDYTVVSGDAVTIEFTTNAISSVNMILEKNGTEISGYLNGNSPVNCKDNEITIWQWVVNITPVANDSSYPTYRIKIVSSDSNTVVAYSNYFKVSING